MTSEPLFAFEISALRKIDPSKYPDVKAWIIKAIAEEDQRPKTQLWPDEPTEENQKLDRLRRIKFLLKHGEGKPTIRAIAHRLAACGKDNRCCSGACPECGWLLQRWFVRKSKSFISDVINKDAQHLVAITIIPSQPIIALGHLVNFSIEKLQRRLQFALDKIGLCAVIGGIDFSYNEDRDGKYQPFWCIHVYIVTSIGNRGRIKRQLKRIYLSDSRIPRPIKISGFSNSARRRSYAFKTIFFRRVGYDAVIKRNGVERKCRDTSQDRLRVRERLELFAYLDQCGLAQRVIFRAAKPIISSSGVRVCEINSVLSYQGNSKKRQKMAKNSAKMGSFARS